MITFIFGVAIGALALAAVLGLLFHLEVEKEEEDGNTINIP
jgi:hypothetical protein